MQKLNIVVHGFVRGSDPRAIQLSLEPFSVNRCVCVQRSGESIPPINAKYCEAIFHDQMRHVDWNTIPSIDEKLIEGMRHCETVFFDIVAREEWRGRVLSYQERKRRYLQHLRYWNYLLEEKEINLFISISLPHRPHSHVLYELCRLKNIPTLFFHNAAPFPDSFLIMCDWRDPLPNIKNRMKELRENITDPDDIHFSEKLNRYINEHTDNRKHASKPWYTRKSPSRKFRKWCVMISKILIYHPLEFLQKSFSLIGRCFIFKYWIRNIRHWNRCIKSNALSRFYDTHAIDPDFSIKYIYVPLQVQPEATTCPMAGAYTNQHLVVQMLDNLLPNDVFIYVKENPNQRKIYPDGRGRSQNFYKDLLSCKNVRFIPISTNTFELIEHSIAVASPTGTAGFEALFRGKPVLLFGNRFYQYVQGVFKINTVDDCKKALHAILQEVAKPDRLTLFIFLKALEEEIISATIEGIPLVFESISDEENAKRVAHAIKEKIRPIVADVENIRECNHVCVNGLDIIRK